MTIKELCYALQKISETEGDLEIQTDDLSFLEDIRVVYRYHLDGEIERVVVLC